MSDYPKTIGGYPVKWVKSWENIPSKNTASNVIAHADTDNDVIYAIKGKTPESDLRHEEYHLKVKKKYERKRPYRSPNIYIREELEATKYAYRQTGQPVHILSKLRALFNDLTFRIGNVSGVKAVSVIGKELKKVKPPIEWVNDYKRLIIESKK